MDKYKRVPKEKVEHDQIKPNEVRILANTQRGARNYITYSINLLTAEGDAGHDTITLRAMGRAINKAISICEIVKRRVAGLHQLTELESNTLVDSFEPLVQGLDPKEVTRTVSCISITLSKKPLDTKNPGYQAPLPEEEVQTEQAAYEKRQQANAQRLAANPDAPRGRGRGRGRDFGRGRGRGSSSSPRGGRGRGGPVRGGRGRGSSSSPRGGRGGAPRGRGFQQDQYFDQGPPRGGRGGGRGFRGRRGGPPRGGRGVGPRGGQY